MSVKSYNDLGPELQGVVQQIVQLHEAIDARKPAPKVKVPTETDEAKDEVREMKREAKHLLHTMEKAMVTHRILQVTDLPMSYEMRLEEKGNSAPLSMRMVREGVKMMLGELGIGVDPELFVSMIQVVRAHSLQQRQQKVRYKFIFKRSKAAAVDGDDAYRTVGDPTAMRAKILDHARSQLSGQRAAGSTPGGKGRRVAAMGT